jgi:hypothetical protein
VTKAEVRAAAETLRAILAHIASGELTASKGVAARLEGAASALEALAGKQGRRSKGDW